MPNDLLVEKRRTDTASHGANTSGLAPVSFTVGSPHLARGDQTSSQATSEGLMSRFEVLVRDWSAETRFMSSVQDMVLNVHYQKVIALGPDVVPLILGRLKSAPEHWFFALHVLTGASPIKPADRGNLPRMAAAWIAWGQENGVID